MPKIRKGTMEQLTTLSEINQLIEDMHIYKKDIFITVKDGSRPIVGNCSRSLINQEIAKHQIVPVIIKLLKNAKHILEEDIRTK